MDFDLNIAEVREKKPREGIDLDQLNTFIDDMRFQPSWRYKADVEADYYDDNQYDAETLAAMADKGLPPVVVNFIKPTINAVLGLEAKTRSDWIVRAETNATDLAEALMVKLKDAENQTRANRACADAYAGQVKAGLHWIEVSKEPNPFKFPLRVRPVHRREIWWDWRAKEADLSDARYLVRRCWYDTEQVSLRFPAYRELIENAGRGWSGFDAFTLGEAHPELAQDYLDERRWGWDEIEWRDTARKRVCLYEVWYRTWQRLVIMTLPGGRVVEVDVKNPAHRLALAKGLAVPKLATAPKLRTSWWLGPHRLADGPTPYNHDEFPYIPFWGYREDKSGAPYGLIRSMRPMQDEINARRAKMLWQLSASRVMADDDAVDDHESARQEVNRADAYLVLNSGRRNANGFRIDEHAGLNAQQFEVYQDAKHGIQDTSGVFQQMLGKQGAASSGIAIQSLVEQSTTTLAEVNDNYRYGRQKVGEHMLWAITAMLKDERNHAVKVDREVAGQSKTVVINAVQFDDNTGQEYLDNDITRERMRVVIDAIPATASYRQQVATQMIELTKSLPPQLQAALIDMVVESTDVPNKDAIAERIRKVTGQVDPNDPENAQAAAQRAKLKAQEMALKHQDAEADIRQKLASAMKDEADAKQTLAKIKQVAAEIEKLKAEVIETRADTAETRADTRQTNSETAIEERKAVDEAETDDQAGPDANGIEWAGGGLPGIAGDEAA